MKSYMILLLLTPCLIMISCAEEAKPSTNVITQNTKPETDTTAIVTDADTLIENSIPEIVRGPYTQASNGLEYKVIQLYVDKYKSKDLRSVHNGIPLVMEPAKHKVFVDKSLVDDKNLGFFEGKYPEFIEAPATIASSSIQASPTPTAVNCAEFYEMKAADFFKNREQLDQRDLLLIVSKAFLHEGAYYVRVRQMSNDGKLIHQRITTYKIDGTGEIIDKSSTNYYQMGYSSISNYLKNI